MERAVKIARINENVVKQRRINELPDELVLKILSMIPRLKKALQHVSYQNSSRILINLCRTSSSKMRGCISSLSETILLQTSTFGFKSGLIDLLHLFSVDFSRERSIASLLLSFPDLEYLVINTTYYYYSEDVCLSSLKTLHLLSSWSIACTSLTRLLQSCTALEFLVISQTVRDSMPIMFSVIPPESCLLSIKTLHLSSVQFWGDEYVAKLLKRCLVLEDLAISRYRYDNVRIYNISVPTLKSLTINYSRDKHTDDDKENHGFWINTPALETLNIKDTVSNILMLEFMPEVTKANIEVTCNQSEKFIGSLTSIQHLSLCSPTSETPYRSGSVFPYLEHLELCTCSEGWANLLASLLNDAPRLQSLKLKSNHSSPCNDPNNFWKEPAVVPKCLLMHLEIFEWRQYEDTVQQRKVAAYILANATCLKMATFSTRNRDKDHCMLMQIKTLNRISETCQLVFE
ncbi:hypothetical protein Bca4012_011108 [Brassica carinata]